MGPGLVYLSEPNKKKEMTEGETPILKYVTAGMQGWRINMEDAHLAVTKFPSDPSAALFGVFDGHGGNNKECTLNLNRKRGSRVCKETFHGLVFEEC